MDEKFLKRKRDILESKEERLKREEEELQKELENQTPEDFNNEESKDPEDDIDSEGKEKDDSEEYSEDDSENQDPEDENSKDEESEEETKRKESEEEEPEKEEVKNDKSSDSKGEGNSDYSNSEGAQQGRQNRKDLSKTNNSEISKSAEVDPTSGGSPKDKMVNAALDKMADKVTENNETARKVAGAVKAAAKIGKLATSSVGFVGKLLTSPIFWVAILLILVISAVSSSVSIIGGNDYNQSCDYNGVGSTNVADDADDFTRQSAIASWLMSTPFEGLGGKPMSREQAVGVIGNLIEESYGADPRTIQGGGKVQGEQTCDNDCVSKMAANGKALGILQWDGVRRKALIEFARSKGTQWYDINTQLEYLKHELDGSEKGSLSTFNQSGLSIEEYTKIWESKVERCGTCRSDERVASAQDFDSKFTGGGSLGGGSGSISTQCVSAGSVDASSLVQLALSIAYSREEKADGKGYGSCDVLKDCGVTFSKPEYIEAKKMAEEASSPDPQSGLLASCDRMAATLYRLTGIDKNFPWGGASNQLAYVNDKRNGWKKVSCQERQPGDAIVRPGHIMVYIGEVDGKDSIASASIALKSRQPRGRSAHIGEISCKGDLFYADGGATPGYRKIGAKAEDTGKLAEKAGGKENDK